LPLAHICLLTATKASYSLFVKSSVYYYKIISDFKLYHLSFSCSYWDTWPGSADSASWPWFFNIPSGLSPSLPFHFQASLLGH
jgi:hypothetical protein